MSMYYYDTWEHFLEGIAVKFQKSGFNVPLYDNRGFGESDGRRYDSDPVKAQDDYIDAFDYAASLYEVDPKRIVFWGTSLAGGVTISAAAMERRVRAVIALVPFVSGELLLGTGQQILEMAERDRVKIRNGEEWPLCRVIASTMEEAKAGSAPVLLRDGNTFRFFKHAATQGGKWENKITMMSLFRFLRFEPIKYIHRIAPTPILMVVGDNNEGLFLPQLQAFGLAKGPKELHILKGGDHVNHYRGDLCEESFAV